MAFNLYLNTREAQLVNGNPADAIFNLNSFNTDWQSIEVSLEECIFPNTIYNVKSNNKTIPFQENGGGTIYTATLTEGYYTGATLATEIATQMNATASVLPWQAIWTNSTGKFTIGTAPANSIKFRFDTLSEQDTTHELLGYNREPDDFISFNTSDHQANLSGSFFIDIVSNLGSLNMSSSGRYSILQRVALDVPAGAIVHYSNQNDSDKSYISNNLDSIEMRIFDDKNELVVLPRTSHISYTLRISPQ